MAAVLPAGCGGRPTDASTAGPSASPAAASSASPTPAVISDRQGPSWRGPLGAAVRVEWYDQDSGETHGELVTVVAVKRFPSADDDAPDEFGDGHGPYEWKYGIKVRLTSLDEVTARDPLACRSLQLSDGVRIESGVAGLGDAGGPDPSQVGVSSTGWLTLRVEEGFAPTEVLLPVGSWQATWALD